MNVSVFVSRASKAFASLAVTVVMAVLTILALALGTVQDSKAEVTLSSALLDVSKVEDLALEWGGVSAGSLPERSAASERSSMSSRTPLSADQSFTLQFVAQGPTQEWMGMSKLAFPLLVKDLVGGRAVQAPTVATGVPVGAAR